MTEATPHLSDESLHEFLDAALASAQRAALEAHLAECPACSTRLARLRALFAELDALPDVQLARDLTPSIMARLKPVPHHVTHLTALRWAVSIQLIVAFALLVVAWPSLEQQTLALINSPLTAQALNTAADLRHALAEQWAAGSAAVNTQIAQSLETMRDLPALPLAQIAWLPLVAAASLLWLIGNGLLVLPTIVKRPTRNHHRE